MRRSILGRSISALLDLYTLILALWLSAASYLHHDNIASNDDRLDGMLLCMTDPLAKVIAEVRALGELRDKTTQHYPLPIVHTALRNMPTRKDVRVSSNCIPFTDGEHDFTSSTIAGPMGARHELTQ